MTMFSKKSALFLSLALLVSASSVVADTTGQGAKNTAPSWADTAKNVALWLPRTAGNELFPKNRSYCFVYNAKGEIEYLSTARMSAAWLAAVGLTTAGVYGIYNYVKPNKKAKTAKPKTNVRSEVTAS